MSYFLWGLGIIVFLLMISLSIAAHEAGHMVVAKRLGLKVPKYFVGFGKTVWSTKRGEGEDETEYGIKMLPLGGFVQIYDPSVKDKDNPERELLSNVTPWRRISVFMAGPMVNIVIGFLLFIIIMMSTPTLIPNNTIKDVIPCSAESVCGAHKAGLLPGDEIIAIDGTNVKRSEELSPYLKNKSEAVITIKRGSEQLDKTVKIDESRLGVYVDFDKRRKTLPESMSTFKEFMIINLQAIISIPEKVVPTIKVIGGEERDEESLTSIVAAGQLYGQTASDEQTTANDKVMQILLYTALINLSLGLINLVPIGILDGGRILIAGIDSVRLNFSKVYKKWNYKPLGIKWVNAMLSVTSIALFGFMILLVVADIVNPVF